MVLYVSQFKDAVAPPPPDPGTISDPNPIPAETQVRYVSPSGSGDGLTTGSPMALTTALNWLDDTAPAGGTVRLLGGTYNVSTFWFNNNRNLGVNSAYRVVRSHDLNNPALLEGSQGGYGMFGFRDGANRICVYGLHGDGNCSQTSPPASADGAQFMFQMGQSNAAVPGKDCHHIWIKACIGHHFWTSVVGTIGADHYDVLPATVNECFLIEDCEFYDNCAGAPWGGSTTSIFYPRPGLTDGQIDTMFKPIIEGSTVICGFIFRRNIGYRNFQSRADPNNGNVFTDGNMLTTDFWNPVDYPGLGTNDYDRAALIENNISFGNGRMYAATATHPSGGVYLRFNTSVYDGTNYRHAFSGTSNHSDHWGGYGGWNNVFRIHANLLVYDPTTNHPNGTGVHRLSGDATGHGGPTSTPLSSVWNLARLNASATLGPAFNGAINTVSTDPGLGAPPSYLAVNSGRIPLATIKAWATPAVNSSASQPLSPYTPTDEVDVFWRPRGAGSLGAVVPGGS